MSSVFSLLFALLIHYFSIIFYRFQIKFINYDGAPHEFWGKPRVWAFLNHTSLFEPLFFGAVPPSFYFDNVSRVVIPGADITLKRPLVGSLYKLLFPQIIPISRKRDATWSKFLNAVKTDKMVVIAPEGRMMRKDGLDKHGKPMSIRSGIADILDVMDSGEMILVYSGGLHHVQAPGEKFFRLFKTLKVNFEKIDIKEFKEKIPGDKSQFHRNVVASLEEKMRHNVPK